MKILFCVKALSTKGGGAERVLTDVANGLVERGHDVSVLTYDKPDSRPFYSLDQRVKRTTMRIGNPDQHAKIWISLRRMVALRRAIVKHAPEITVGVMHSMFIPMALALVGTGIPVVASEHIVPKHYENRRIQAWLLSLMPWFVHRITCISEQVRQSYSPALARKMVPVANPVTIQVQNIANVVGMPGERKVLVTAGRMDDQKDHETLIRAFGQISDKLQDWDLKIFGDGELRNQLEKVIESLNLQKRVFMPGITDKIADEYSKAQLFVLSSRYESFGLTTAEALLHGLPAVGFEDCQGTNLLIRHEQNGELAKASDDSEQRAVYLAETLYKLMSDGALRQKYAEAAPKGIYENHGIDSVVDAWEALLSDVLSGSKGPANSTGS